MDVGGLLLTIFVFAPAALCLIGYVYFKLSELYDKRIKSIDREENNQISRYKTLADEAEKAKEFYESKISTLDECVKKKAEAFPHIAAIMADLLVLNHIKLDRDEVKYYHWKNAKNQQISDESHRLMQEKKLAEYKLSCICSVFPEVNKIFENDFELKDKQIDLLRDEVFQAIEGNCNFNDIFNSLYRGKLFSAFDTDLQLKSLFVEADIRSGDHYYLSVTLDHCGCKDFQIHKQPCKHMLYLAYILGILQTDKNRLNKLHGFTLNQVNKLIKQKQDLDDKIKSDTKAAEKIIENATSKAEKIVASAKLEASEIKKRTKVQIKELEKASQRIKESYDSDIETIRHLISKKFESYPIIAGQMADYLTLHYMTSAELLEHKKPPALKEAKRIRELQKETREIVIEKKSLEYKLAYIEKLFPNINDIFDPGFDESADFELETEENTDRVRLFLTPEEYNSLSTTEKNQLALNRYVERRKSKWQVGRDYEMYVGHRLEARGFKVKYTGNIENLEDMGRDLIATSGKTTYIIQCKNWAADKTINEKHVFQLYGTVILYRLENPMAVVKGVFITTTQLSAKARAVADELGISVVEHLPLGEFPRIKCNINREDGEKIYHLPFDQQYDKTVIEEQNGEFYAFTVAEAESKGFRRAWRHFAQ